ncbi:right-handed parallel beta-helix repeat-containing protein, partial [bacterium]|nr:right-handed parallel beta-helix repeat-containing protein [bacterium]
SGEGVYLTGSSNNRLTGNTALSNSSVGFAFVTSANNNTLTGNVLTGNLTHGVSQDGSSGNVFVQNTISSNTQYQVYILNNSSSDTFSKNNIQPSGTNPDSGVYNTSTAAGNKFTFTRNWWNSTDSDRIKKLIYQTGIGDSLIWQPFRLGAVDTASGADTTAPKAPDTVATIDTTGGQIKLEWSAVTALEEANGGAVGLSGYRVYRSKIKDTSSWIQIGQVGSGVIQFTDTTVTANTGYYYRVTAFDAAAFANESFFSDSQPVDTGFLYTGPNWYVNDTYSSAADSYTYAGGSDTGSGDGSASKPFRSLAKVMQKVKSGDTIWLDAGQYGSDTWEMISSTETVAVNLDTDNLALIGKDSGATVIDPAGAKTEAGLYGIYADTQVGLTIKNLGVTGAYDGIHFNSVDNSRVEGDSASHNGNYGIHLTANSDTNTVTGNDANWNANSGIVLNTSSGNTVSNNTVNSNSAGSGIYLLTSASNNTVNGNFAGSNGYGIFVSTGSNNRLTANTTASNTLSGIVLASTADNRLSHNMSHSNSIHGLYLNGGLDNTLTQNEARSNTQYQIYIDAGAARDTAVKNNIMPSATNPDSGVGNYSTAAANKFTFTRNWWNTTDETRIRSMIYQASNGDSIIWSPYRLGVVDTAAGADTTAPGLPTSVTIDTPAGGKITLTWVIPTINEETNGGAVGFGGVRIYRLRNTVDTTHWANTLVWTAGATDTTWTDTGVAGGDTFYYRLTSRDAAAYLNESFFTDTKFAAPDTSVTVSLTSPANGHETTAVTLAFVWTSTDAETYTWQRSLSSAFTTVSDSVVDTTVTSVTRTAAANDTYYWRVIGKDRAGNTDTTSPRGFVVDTQVGQVTLVSPSDGHDTTNTAISLQLSALSDSVGIDSYVIEAAKTPAFTTTVFADTIDGSLTSDTITGLYNDTYYWRARAVDNLGNVGANSAIRGFVVDTAVGQVSLVAPSDGHETTNTAISLQFSALSDSVGIDSYVIEAAKTPAFTTSVFADTIDGSLTSDTITGLYNDTYYWRARAVDNLGNVGANSATRGFIVDTQVTKVTLTSPASGSVTEDTTPTLTWTAVSDSVGIDSYVVEVSDADTFGAIVFADTVDGSVTSDTVLPDLASDTYWWRVRGIDNLGNVGANSDSFQLRIDTTPATVTLVSPASGHETTAATIAFVWSGVNVDTYTWQLSRSAAFTTISDSVADTTATSVTRSVAANDTYYWRVIGWSNLGLYDTKTSGFVVDTFTAQVTLTAPTDGHETTNATISLQLSALSDSVGIDSYVIEAAKTPAFTTTVFADTIDGTLTSDTITGLYN